VNRLAALDAIKQLGERPGGVSGRYGLHTSSDHDGFAGGALIHRHGRAWWQVRAKHLRLTGQEEGMARRKGANAQ
jgi:hypothetical protein